MSKGSERVKKWRRETKKRIIESMGGKCVVCGYNKCHEAMELHHINPEEKDFGISSIARKNAASWKKICKELRKCVLVCCRCHREIHAKLIDLPEIYSTFNEEYSDYKSAKKKPIKKTSVARKTKIDWPSYEELARMIEETNFVQVGKMLGVSDNAVKKRMKKIVKEVPEELKTVVIETTLALNDSHYYASRQGQIYLLTGLNTYNFLFEKGIDLSSKFSYFIKKEDVLEYFREKNILTPDLEEEIMSKSKKYIDDFLENKKSERSFYNDKKAKMDLAKEYESIHPICIDGLVRTSVEQYSFS